MAKDGMPAMEQDYMAESDLRTLIEAEKIKMDKPRHKAAMQKHKEMMAAMQKMHAGMNGNSDKGKM